MSKEIPSHPESRTIYGQDDGGYNGNEGGDKDNICRFRDTGWSVSNSSML